MNRSMPRLDGLRIAQLSESDGPGGAERMLADLSAALTGAGAQVVAFLPMGGEGWLARELAAAGIPIEHYPPGGPLSAETQHFIARGLYRHRVSVVHSHEFTMAVAGAWASRRIDVPHVITMHGSRYYAGRITRRLALRMAVSLSAATVAVSEDLSRAMQRDLWLLNGAVGTVPNGISARRPSGAPRLRSDLRLTARARVILAVGNLYPVKGHRDLLDAVALLPPPFDTTHVAIAGRGDEERPLLAHAADLGILDRVHLLGLRTDIPDLLAAADVFALPSHAEGLSLALLEAMDAGLPVVATDVGDTRRALDNGAAGIVVPPHHPAALAAGIARLLGDRAKATEMGARARARAVTSYGHETMVARYAALYQHAVDSTPGMDRVIRLQRAAVVPAPRRSITSGSRA